MIKLYKYNNKDILYWEIWQDIGCIILHWGKVGDRGQSNKIKIARGFDVNSFIQIEIKKKLDEGFKSIPLEDHHRLIIEYYIYGIDNKLDLNKRQKLENRLNETLGWKGLGHCDGGSMGSGTMEVFCFVIDFDIGRKVVENDLELTEFNNYSRIFIK